jgi:lysine decarboxylase
VNSELRESAPLLNAYLEYFERRRTPFTIPGHKQRAHLLDAGLGLLVDPDTPLYGGLDEIKLTEQTLKTAEGLAATFWGADYARFSAGGSTHANQAIVLALGAPGEKVAVSRTAHRSILSGLVLAGLEPLWMSPEIDEKTGIPIGIPLREIERVLEAKPVAILLTEPGYLGTLSDLPPIIAAAHAADTPVIIDAAWGAHFGFSPLLPQHVIALGADALITSIHKALPGYTAAALLLAQGKYLNLNRIEQGFETTHTTSPAGAPLASVDAVRALLAARGAELTTDLVERVTAFKARVQSNFELPVFLYATDFPAGRFDSAKIVVRTNNLGCSGIDIENALLESGIRVEMADKENMVMLATIADRTEDFDTLADALIPAMKKLQGEPRAVKTSVSWSIAPQTRISMRSAYFAKTELVPASEAIGRISADLVAPYPPGVAVLAPGEIITEAIVDGLLSAKRDGVRIAYATDPSLTRFNVVAD